MNSIDATETAVFEAPKAEQDAFDQISNVVWTAQNTRLAAAENAIRASIRAAHPDAVSARFGFTSDFESSHLDFEALLDQDGHEIEINEDVARDVFGPFGSAYDDFDDAREWTDRHESAAFDEVYFIDAFDAGFAIPATFGTASAEDFNLVINDQVAAELFELLKARLGK